MKKLFYTGAFLLILFEIANVYFIMPMPGSQEMKSIDIAYFLYSSRWIFRVVLGLMVLVGLSAAWKSSKWLAMLILLIVGGLSYMVHCEMAADTMFYQPGYVQMESSSKNKVSDDRIILGVDFNGEAKAYPIQFLGYHHKVFDTIGGKPIMVTYCTVCRSGRVYEPMVNGKEDKFRLVGMDHFNAMFEDHTTKSWWRQATGEAIAGPLKGQQLPEVPAIQTSLATWLTLHPHSLIMQPDTNYKAVYDDLSDYETGLRKGDLTRHDTASWHDKSWVVGIIIHNAAKAYDWNELVKKGIINDTLQSTPLAIVVTKDERSFFAYKRSSELQQLSFRNDTLTDGVVDFTLLGTSLDTLHPDLKIIPVYQEYWHSWRTFHPATAKY